MFLLLPRCILGLYVKSVPHGCFVSRTHGTWDDVMCLPVIIPYTACPLPRTQ